MTRSERLTEEDLEAIANELDLPPEDSPEGEAAVRRVRRDMTSARNSGVVLTPSFFIDNRRYRGPWDDASFADALRGSLGHRMQAAALEFVNWPPSTGFLLVIATVLAVVLSNSPIGPAVAAIWCSLALPVLTVSLIAFSRKSPKLPAAPFAAPPACVAMIGRAVSEPAPIAALNIAPRASTRECR